MSDNSGQPNPGQTNQGQPGQPGQPRAYPNLIRPEELQKATFLDDATRTKYTVAFRQFWNYVEQKPPGSPEHVQALAKLTEWSQKLKSLAQQHRVRMQQQQQAALKAQQGQNQGQQEQQQGSASPVQKSGVSQPPQAQQAQQSHQPQQPATQQSQSQSQAQGQSQGQAQSQPQGQAQGATQNAAARPNQPSHIPPAILQHVTQFQYALPPNVTRGTPEAENKIKEMRNSYAISLAKQEYSANQIKRLTQMIEQKAKDGQDSTDLQTAKRQQEQAFNSMKSFVEDFRKKQQAFREMEKARQQQSTANQQAGGSAPSTTAPGQLAGATPAANATSGGVQIKTEGGNAPAAVAAPPNAAPAGATQGQGPSAASQAAGQINSGRPLQSPATSQTQTSGQFNQAALAQSGQPQLMNGQGPIRPGSIPGQAQGPLGQMGQMQHGSPATQGQPGAPVALTHHAAVAQAAQNHANRTGTPQSASLFRPAPPENPNQTNNPKMPIPKQLSVPPPTPVTMGPGRPTMGGPSNGAPGMMGQPVIHKLPAYMLEGDGDRVLSKKKLDELVRQVTGGGEGTQGESLMPEVEEVSSK